MFPFLASAADTSNMLEIPTAIKYRDFLLGSWKAENPTLTIFVDPFCPYCLKSLDRKYQFANYNTFLFWAPILGDRSISRVNEIFACKNVVGDRVIESVIKRLSPQCEQPTDKEAVAANMDMLNQYNPNTVPAYYLGGRRVSLAQLDLAVESGSVLGRQQFKINWQRYEEMSVSDVNASAKPMGLLVPSAVKLSLALVKQLENDKLYQWYVFIEDKDSPLFDRFCSVSQCDKQLYVNRYSEFMLLTAIPIKSSPVVVKDGVVSLLPLRNYLQVNFNK